MPPRVETIKIPLPDAYAGARGQADIFIEGMEAYFKFTAQHLNDAEKVYLSSVLLKDAARSWFKGAPDDAFPTWEDFKEKLMTRFALHNAVNSFSDALYNLQQAGKPIQLHDQQFENLVLQLENAGLKLSDDEAFQRYRQSLNGYYRDKLAEHTDVKTYRDAFEKLEALPSPHVPGLPSMEALMGTARLPYPEPPARAPRYRLRQVARRNYAAMAYHDRPPPPHREPIKSGYAPRNVAIYRRSGSADRNQRDRDRAMPPRQAPRPAATGDKLANVKCFRCKENGHYAKDCPMPYDPANQAH